MKNIKKLTIIFILIIVTFFGIFFSFNFMKSGKKIPFFQFRITDNDIGQFSITWITDNKTNSHGITSSNDKSVLTVSPNENNIYNEYNNTGGGAQVTYQLVFNMGGSEDIPVGAIKIKLPKNVFYGRDGLPLSTQIIDVPLVEYPNAEGTGFNYRYELDPTDNQEYLILENYQVIPASYAFECSITWILPTPSTVANGYTKTIQGKLSIDSDLDGNNEIETESNTLTMNYASHAKVNSYTMSYSTHTDTATGKSVNVYTSWNKNWSADLKPENPDDYVYAIWYTDGRVNYATQPYTAVVTARSTDELGGEVIGYCRYYYTGYENTCFGQTTEGRVQKNQYEYAFINTPSKSYEDYEYTYFMVKYPKSNLHDGEEHSLNVESTLTINGIDGDVDTKTATSSKKYQYIEIPATTVEQTVGFLPKTYNSVYKNGYTLVSGGINALEAGRKIVAGNSGTEGTVSNNYNFSNTLRFYPLTLKEGGDATNPEDYGQNTWDAVLVDDTLLLGNDPDGFELLQEGDYEFTTLGVGSYSGTNYIYSQWSSTNSSTKVTTNYTGWTTTSTNTSDLPPILLYYKKNGEWNYFAKVTKVGNYTYDYELLDETIKSYDCTNKKNNIYGIPLPEGVSGVKAVSTNKNYSISMTLYVHVRLKPSAHVKNIMKNQKSVKLYNYSGSYAVDYKGNIYSKEVDDRGSYQTLPNGKISEIVNAKDIADYGKEIYHYHYYSRPYTEYGPTTGYATIYTRIVDGKTYSDKWVKYSNNTAKRRIEAEYTAVSYERVTYNSNNLSDTDMIDMKILKEQKAGTFYDLLPKGMTVSPETVTVETFDTTITDSSTPSSPTSLKAGIVVPTKVSKIENWKNSGRTMMVVSVALPADQSSNYVPKGTSTERYVYSGFVLKFTGYYDWDRIPDYGNSLVNTVAYKSENTDLSNGYADDSSELSSSYVDKDYFIDLDQDGNASTKKDTVYAQRSASFSFNTASDSFFNKAVITPGLDEYTDGQDGSAKTTGGGYYTYRLRYATQRNLSTSDLVIYDILENYQSKDKEQWKGSFVSIDTSQIEKKGANPVVYYSTSDPSSFNIYDNGKASIDKPLPSSINDLANNSKWTTTPPDDLSRVTAIAIDISKKKSGDAFILENEESVVATITMQAPTRNVEELEKNNAYAYNAAWWSGTTKQGDEPAHFNLSVYEYTKVGITTPKLNIRKTAKVNKKDLPTVKFKENLVYNLSVSNNNEHESFSKVIIEDDIPSNVTPNLDEISFYKEGIGNEDNSTLLKDSSLVKMTNSGSKLTFEISQILAQEEIHILIPTTPKSLINTQVDNNFALKAFNNKTFEIKSETTEHRIETGTIKVNKRIKGDLFPEKDEFQFIIRLMSPEVFESRGRSIRENEFRKELQRENDHDSISKEMLEEVSANSTEIVDESVNGEIGGLTFENGVAKFTVKSNESLEIKNLPAGYYYEIEEVGYEVKGYTMTSSGEKGQIIDQKTSDVEFVNTYTVKNPKTYVPIVIILGTILSLSIFPIYRIIKKEKANE